MTRTDALTRLRARTPHRPGPGPMPDALLRALHLDVRRRIDGLLAGDFRSAAFGQGTELAMVRRYEPGDDVRWIEWNVTARMGEPHVRVFVAERALTTWALLDRSPSMGFGTVDRRKADVAEGVVLAIGHLATRRGNRLGLTTFGDAVSTTVPPGQGRRGLLGALATMREDPPSEGPGGSLEAALRRVRGLARPRGVVVVISDLRGPVDWTRALAAVAERHEVIIVEIRDPREEELPDVGTVWLVDPETGRHLRVDTSHRRLREHFVAAAAAERAGVRAAVLRTGSRHIVVSTSGDWLRTLAAAMSQRRPA